MGQHDQKGRGKGRRDQQSAHRHIGAKLPVLAQRGENRGRVPQRVGGAGIFGFVQADKDEGRRDPQRTGHQNGKRYGGNTDRDDTDGQRGGKAEHDRRRDGARRPRHGAPRPLGDGAREDVLVTGRTGGARQRQDRQTGDDHPPRSRPVQRERGDADPEGRHPLKERPCGPEILAHRAALDFTGQRDLGQKRARFPHRHQHPDQVSRRSERRHQPGQHQLGVDQPVRDLGRHERNEVTGKAARLVGVGFDRVVGQGVVQFFTQHGCASDPVRRDHLWRSAVLTSCFGF